MEKIFELTGCGKAVSRHARSGFVTKKSDNLLNSLKASFATLAMTCPWVFPLTVEPHARLACSFPRTSDRVRGRRGNPEFLKKPGFRVADRLPGVTISL
jgi:hypothetical protein